MPKDQNMIMKQKALLKVLNSPLMNRSFNMNDSEIIYLRPTGINTFLDCSAKYLFQEIEKIETPNKSYLAFGSSIHRTLEINYYQKIETNRDLPVEETKAIFADTIDAEFQKVDKLDFIDETPGTLKDQGIRLIEKYQREVAPRIIPIAVEQKIKAKFKGYDYGLSGTIDLYDSNDNVVDHKTTGKQIDGTIPLGYQRQLSAYAILEEATGRKVSGARIDFL